MTELGAYAIGNRDRILAGREQSPSSLAIAAISHHRHPRTTVIPAQAGTHVGIRDLERYWVNA